MRLGTFCSYIFCTSNSLAPYFKIQRLGPSQYIKCSYDLLSLLTVQNIILYQIFKGPIVVILSFSYWSADEMGKFILIGRNGSLACLCYINSLF